MPISVDRVAGPAQKLESSLIFHQNSVFQAYQTTFFLIEDVVVPYFKTPYLAGADCATSGRPLNNNFICQSLKILDYRDSSKSKPQTINCCTH